MKGELNDLITKILNKYPQAYVRSFAHQLQLAL